MRGTDTSNTRLVERAILLGPLGTTVRVQPNRAVSLIVCSIKQGAVGVWFGSNNAGLVPDLFFNQAAFPVWVPIPAGVYEFCLVALDANQNTQASVIFGGPDAG